MRLFRVVAALSAVALLSVTGGSPIQAEPSPRYATATTLGAAATSTTVKARVLKVVDGDTIRTTKGTVRLIGVDTPEVNRCNAAQATANARRLAPVGSTVKLIKPKGNNKDRYGRLLRYVTGKGVDIGGSQIKKGLADARYDSVDGYPRHPKQAKYRAWDKRYPDKKCGKTSQPKKDTYRGCRAYGPKGTRTDDQGRRYTPIDCKTRRPL